MDAAKHHLAGLQDLSSDEKREMKTMLFDKTINFLQNFTSADAEDVRAFIKEKRQATQAGAGAGAGATGSCLYRIGGGRTRFRRFPVVPGDLNSVKGLLDKVTQDLRVEGAECSLILPGGHLADPPVTLSPNEQYEINPKCFKSIIKLRTLSNHSRLAVKEVAGEFPIDGYVCRTGGIELEIGASALHESVLENFLKALTDRFQSVELQEQSVHYAVIRRHFVVLKHADGIARDDGCHSNDAPPSRPASRTSQISQESLNSLYG